MGEMKQKLEDKLENFKASIVIPTHQSQGLVNSNFHPPQQSLQNFVPPQQSLQNFVPTQQSLQNFVPTQMQPGQQQQSQITQWDPQMMHPH